MASDPRHGILPVSFMAGYALLFGVTLATVAGLFGVGADAAFLDMTVALSLVSFAVIASTSALVALIGPAGSAIAGVVYFVIGAQISGAGTAPEFLPSFWHDLGQALPVGAGVSLLRDVFYFPDAATGGAVAVLAAYAGVGTLTLIAVNAVRSRRNVASEREIVAAAPAA
jgi:hypothetical protein